MTRHLLRHLSFALVLASAAVLLTWRLGAVYLWQDEAATAVLAGRMLQYGKPLAWDGRNVITMDSFVDEDVATVGQRTGSADAELRYLVARRDFRPDGAWVGQPWGQFVAAAAGLALLGHDTVAARLPFALAALATVILLYFFALRTFEDPVVATLAAALLVANAFWILHSRQCRYYALSSLTLLGSVAAYARWQRGARWGAPLFLAVGWLYFQSDFGSFFPSMAVLGVVALLARRRPVAEILGTFAALGVAVAPFAWYYEILGRFRNPAFGWRVRFDGIVFDLDAFVIPLVALLAAAFLLWRARRSVVPVARDVLVAIVAMLVLIPFVWVPLVAPAPFLRYIVQLAPVAALLLAWALARAGEALASATGRAWARPAAIAAGVLLVAITGIASVPTRWALFPRAPSRPIVVRPELPSTFREVFLPRPDPNRDVIEAIAPLLHDGDEILVNYEDIPFMFYTHARIRGGVSAFRVEDRSAPPARFLVLRRTVPFVHWPVFLREADRYLWRPVLVSTPDVPFGNNPDPPFVPFPTNSQTVVVAERVGS